MNLVRSLLVLALVGQTAVTLQTCVAKESNHDVVIYGGTSAAVIAAVQVTKMDKTVVVVCPEKHLGGLTAGGLGWTDSGQKRAVGGLSRDFYQRLKKHYDRMEAWRQQKPGEYSRYRKDDDAMWVFEPHVAEQTFETLVREFKIPVFRDQWLDRAKGVKKADGRIVAITTLSGDTYRGKVFIDATYEGDLLAAAGVSFAVGRESNSQYGETLNGVQTKNARKHQFINKIDPYVTPGDPEERIAAAYSRWRARRRRAGRSSCSGLQLPSLYDQRRVESRAVSQA